MRKLNLDKYDGDSSSLYLFSTSFVDNQELFLNSAFEGESAPISLTKNDYIKKHEMTVNVFHEYLPLMAEYLNAQNKLNYSLSFWHPFLAYWMVTVIDLFIDKKMKLEAFLESTDESFKIELLECDNNFIFKDDQSFNSGHATSTLFDHLFTSLVIEYLNPSMHQISRKKVDNVSIDTSSVYKKADPVFFNQRVEHVSGFNKLQISILSMFLNIYSHFSKKVKLEEKTILTQSTLPETIDWLKILKKVMPESYLKLNFSNIEFPFKKGVSIFSTYKFPLEKRALVGLLREKGIKVYLAQHGSSYGDLLTVTRNYTSEYLLDGFISWGWDSHLYHPAKIIALPSPIMSKLKLRKILFPQKRSKIILISSVFAPNDTAGSFATAEFYPEYFQNICTFLDHLDDEAKEKFYYRPRLTHGEVTFNNALVALITKKYPWVKILQGSLDREMLSARIIIHDNFGSALQKSLILCPISLFFWKKNSFYLNQDLQSVFDQLEEEKGYFTSGKSAAIEVNRIVQNKEKKTKLSGCYKKLEPLFFKTTFFPFFSWIRALRKF